MTIMHELRAGGLTSRLHTFPTIRTQNVAAHSWGVAMLARHIYYKMGEDIPSHVLVSCLTHDIPEGRVGDVPSPVKWEHPRLAKELANVEAAEARKLGIDAETMELSNEENALVDFCDKLELLWHCVDERRLGNAHIVRVFENQLEWFKVHSEIFIWSFGVIAHEMLEEVSYFFHNPDKKEMSP